MYGECLYCKKEISDYEDFCNDECEEYYTNGMEETDAYDYITNGIDRFDIDADFHYEDE